MVLKEHRIHCHLFIYIFFALIFFFKDLLSVYGHFACMYLHVCHMHAMFVEAS